MSKKRTSLRSARADKRLFGFKITNESREAIWGIADYPPDGEWTEKIAARHLEFCRCGWHFYPCRSSLISSNTLYYYGEKKSKRRLWLIEVRGRTYVKTTWYTPSGMDKAVTQQIRFLREIRVERGRNLKKLEHYVESWLRKEARDEKR